VQPDGLAIDLAKELISMLTRGGFRLTKFLCNKMEVLEALRLSDVSPSAVTEIRMEKMERASGYAWDTVQGEITFTLTGMGAASTKRASCV
jgi:hypothetical protein